MYIEESKVPCCAFFFKLKHLNQPIDFQTLNKNTSLKITYELNQIKRLVQNKVL